jgi:excisionase family DNA binding protein
MFTVQIDYDTHTYRVGARAEEVGVVGASPGKQPAPSPERILKDDERLLTPDQVCVILGVTKEWLYVQVQRERIAVVRLNGRSLRFRAIDLERWLESQHVRARNG